MAAAETIIKFKHLSSLMSQCKGHARVREAPRVAAGARADCLHASLNHSPGNPAMPSSACENSRFPDIGLPASNGTGSTTLEECDSGGFYEERKSLRGDSHIDLNHQVDSSADYEGSINEFSWRGYNNTEDMIKGCDYPSIAKDYGNIKHKPYNYGFLSMIDYANPSSLDLNQEAPSLDSSSSLTSPVANFMLPSSAKQTMPPLFCPKPTVAFLPPSQESFSFDAHTKSAPVSHSQATPSASNTTSTSMEDDFTKLAHNPHQKSTLFYEGQDEGSLTGKLPQIFSVNSHAHLEKAACLIPTPTYSLPSYINLEGNLSTNGNVPVFQQPQPAMASKASSEGTKRKCPSISDNSNLTKCGNNPSKCHCARRRRLKKKSIIRVPAISEKVAEIPQDDYSWRKYGQKPIKGSPFPRGYYKCSGVKGCPAKKHVERALDDPAMLIVTYEGEHIHSRLVLEEPSQI